MPQQYFTPPTDSVVPARYVGGRDDTYPVIPSMHKLFRFYKNGDRGRNVFALSDGTFTETQPPNWNPQNPSAPYAVTYDGVTQTSTSFSAATYVTKVYWGGCANPVTAAEVTALTAAGYGPYIA